MFHQPTALACARASKLAYSNYVGGDGTFLEAKDTQAVVIPANGKIIVAFRGTESIRDWLANVKAIKTGWRGGHVHLGFLEAWIDIRQQIINTLRKYPGRPIVITGHSLGGALATLCAYDLETNGLYQIEQVYTFGSPRVGNRKFAKQFGKRFKGRSYRIINDSDIVCRVPSMLRWRHVSQAVFYDQYGTGEISKPPFWYGLLEMAENIVRFKPGNSFTDHSIEDYIKLLT